MPSLTQLEYIVAVSQLRHFGEAAKACHISQPTLSMQIQKAEEALGVILFDREQKPIGITAKGAPIIEQAKVVLYEHERLKLLSQESAHIVSGTFHLGIIPTLAPYLVPNFIEPFSKYFPKVKLNIDEMKTHDIIDAIGHRQIDGGILATPLHEKDLSERVIFYEPFFLYAHEDHPILLHKHIDGSKLNVNDMWLLQDGHCFRNQVINFCSSQKSKGSLAENVSFESGNFETLRNLVRSSGGYTLLPFLFVKSLPEAEQKRHVRLFINPTPTREISIVHKSHPLKESIIKAIEDILKTTLPAELSAKKAKSFEVLDI